MAATYKERAKRVEKEMLELDHEQASLHIDVLKRFMPDSLFSIDFDGVRMMLLVKRLVAKSRIARDFVVEQFRMEEDVGRLLRDEELTIDQYAFACDINEMATFIISEGEYFLGALHKAKVSTFHGLTSQLGELIAIETGLDQLLRLIISEDLDFNGSFAELRAAAQRLHVINISHLEPILPPTPSEHMAMAMPILSSAAESIVAQLQNFKVTVSQGLEGQLEVPTERLLAYLHTVEEKSTMLKQAARKIFRKLPDEKEVTLEYGDDVKEVTGNATYQAHEANGIIRSALLAVKVSL